MSADPVAYKNWGGGFSWQPTPRTQFSVQTEQRYFGRSWNISLSHRMRRTVVVYSDSNSDNNATTGAGAPLTTYDLFFAQFASIEPDPARRDVLVRNFLRAAGLNPNEQATGGFISRAVTVTRSQNLSLALQGRRQTAVLSAFATSSRRVDTLSTAEDDLSQVYRLDQQGVSLSLSHRLTQTSSVGLFASLQRTPSSDGVQGNDLREITLSWSDRIGSRSTVSIEARHSQATGGNPYKENNVLARFNYSF
ncbi:MAG: TIGR03016 family PEP-CTERM system-associated outer membrane protein [Rubrivivax sp.]|nr:TIGR03016 family PEP-CTERM system-associated outer membrane protein [Rubrivivax sp.]